MKFESEMGVTAKKRTIRFLGTALGILLLFRGVGLGGRGLMEHDEGHAMLNAFTYRNIIEWTASGEFLDGQRGIAEIRDTLHKGGGTLYSAGKSGYSYLLAFVSFLSGEMTARVALFWAWVAGVITLLSAGGVAYYFSGRKAAAFWICVFGAALSPNLLYSSREVSGVIWSLAFGFGALAVMAAADSWRGGRYAKRLLYGAGLLLGYGFTCHFNLAPFLVAAMLSYAVWLLTRESDPLSIKKIINYQIIIASGGLTVAAVFQTVTGLAAIKLAPVYPEYQSFFDELSYLLLKDQGQKRAGVLYGDGVLGYGPEAWAFYGKALWREGWLWICALALAVISSVRSKRDFQRSLPAIVLFLIPTLFWAAAVYKVERVLGMCILGSWILIAGVAASYLSRRNLSLRKKVALLGAVLFAGFVLSQQFPRWIHLLTSGSSVPRVAHHALLYATKNNKLITAGSFDLSFAPLWKWNLIESRRKIIGSEKAIDFSKKTGETIIFIDGGTWKYLDKKEFNYSPEDLRNFKLVNWRTGTIFAEKIRLDIYDIEEEK